MGRKLFGHKLCPLTVQHSTVHSNINKSNIRKNIEKKLLTHPCKFSYKNLLIANIKLCCEKTACHDIIVSEGKLIRHSTFLLESILSYNAHNCHCHLHITRLIMSAANCSTRNVFLSFLILCETDIYRPSNVTDI